jgi:tetratricopeptide (TPR) repeat protein
MRANLPSQGFKPLVEARRLLGAKAYREAHAYCRKIAQQDPTCADAFYVLGIISYEHHDFTRALKLFEVAIENKHPEAGPYVQAARCLGHLNRPKEALEQIEAAKKLNPTDGFTLASIGAMLSRLDLHNDAAIYHRKATEAAPNDAMSFFNLGSSLQFIGDIEGAKTAYKAALDIAPNYTPALVHLVLMDKHTKGSKDMPRLIDAWDGRHPQDIEGGLRLAHAIAKIHQDTAEPAAAMVWLDRGKALIRAAIPDRSSTDAASFDAAKALSRSLSPSSNIPLGGPIFIVGLPRTGTTLLDRIVASHSQIISAGERTEFGAILQSSTGSGHAPFEAETIVKSGEVDLLEAGKDYLENIAAILRTELRFTDKMPLNAFFAPAILSAIPNARVICLRRHPADSVLSMYRQLFAVSAMSYRSAYDLESLAHYVAGFHDMIDTYTRELPPSRFTVLDYEALVDEPEAQIRRILAFCGLEFEAECLAFQNNAAPVGTASVTQVRQPLYTTAKGRWKKYREHLKPALSILKDYGIEGL